LHSLVLIFAKDHYTGVSEANRIFASHEIMTPETIANDLVGQADRPDLINIILNEIKRRVLLKLSLGERVVVIAPSFGKLDQRMALVRSVISEGASVIYLVQDNNDSEILCGDHLADVQFLNRNMHISKALVDNPLQGLRKRFRGITVVGDIHGRMKALDQAMSWALSRNHFLWFLGDVLDCGADSLETIEMVYDVVMRGDGAFVLGNHERKIARWLSEHETGHLRMRLSDGNKVTVDALGQLPLEQKQQWVGKFRSLMSRASLMNHVGNITFVHAAVHPDVWTTQNDQRAIEDYALYGESNISKSEFVLSYKWVDFVPDNHLVFVGHDVRSTIAPMVITGAKGGRVIFLDTGSGKGGYLSTADIRFSEDGELHLENFNRH
jgi:hypothetical protein